MQLHIWIHIKCLVNNTLIRTFAESPSNLKTISFILNGLYILLLTYQRVTNINNMHWLRWQVTLSIFKKPGFELCHVLFSLVFIFLLIDGRMVISVPSSSLATCNFYGSKMAISFFFRSFTLFIMFLFILIQTLQI